MGYSDVQIPSRVRGVRGLAYPQVPWGIGAYLLE
jgi:hypothetical protein